MVIAYETINANIATNIVTSGGATTSLVACALASHDCIGFYVRADGGNAGNIWVGASNVSSSIGLKLSADQYIFIQALNTKIAYVYATSSTQNYQFLALI